MSAYSNPTLDAALAYLAAGLSLIPVKRDGSKAPAVRAWKQYQQRLPTDAEVRRWFDQPEPPGIAILGGDVSGGLETIDFDKLAESIFPQWRELIEAERPGLVARLSVVRTPRPGYHVRYRCIETAIPGNCKLAVDPTLPADDRTLIETRGRGGYALAPGSPPACHETGKTYEHVAGPDLAHLEVISAADREVLLRCARSFDREPGVEAATPVEANTSGLRPGDDFNARGPDWFKILAGWTVAREFDGKRYWARPGKDRGWSATTGVCTSKDGVELFCCFSENAAPFRGASGGKPCSCYSRFAAYALLNHGGDFPAAAKELGRQGYGNQDIRCTATRPAAKTHERNGDGRAAAAEAPATPAWHAPIPFDAAYDLPPFPSHLLSSPVRTWIEAEALATQTPPDLAGMLALSICGAALATKVRVVIREGWSEPTNLFTVTALAPGERKSAVHRHALAPVVEYEREERERMAPLIAEAASEHRQMEARLKRAEQDAAKADDPAERRRLSDEAKELAKELAAHVVPEPPEMFCDDVTPEALGRLLAKQGGRMLQASPEGTAFEIVKGRYSESPNFDVYLKAHAGDPLRVGRVSRDGEMVDQPALSAALAVQPDVIQGLAAQAILRGRGFLARWLYSMPLSEVGRRVIAARPVPKAVEAAYREAVLRLWRLEGAVADGKPAAHLLQFSPDADRRMQDFERWLEPQLAEGEELSVLAGWANKVAGAAARIAASMHVLEALSAGRPWYRPIDPQTVDAAIALARGYLLPHAQAAFVQMGADGKAADAKHVWVSIARRRSEISECSENGGACLSRRDIHQWNRRRFPAVEQLDPVLALLSDRCYLRPVGGTGLPGRGHASPAYEVNPLALAAFENEAPRAHCTQRTHSDAEPTPCECNEDSESAPPCSAAAPDPADAGGYIDPTYRDDGNPFRHEEAI